MVLYQGRRKKLSIPIYDVNFVMIDTATPTQVIYGDGTKVFDSYSFDRDGYGCCASSKAKNGELFVYMFINVLSSVSIYKKQRHTNMMIMAINVAVRKCCVQKETFKCIRLSLKRIHASQ